MAEETSALTTAFDQFFDQLRSAHPNIDPELLVKIMLFEKSLKDYVGPVLPHVHLDVTYEKGVDLKQKQEEGRDKFPIEVTTNKWGDAVIFSGLMGVRHVEKVCSDPQIAKVTGTATPRHN